MTPDTLLIHVVDKTKNLLIYTGTSLSLPDLRYHDTTSRIESLMKEDGYHVPRDYTAYFRKRGAPLPLEEATSGRTVLVN